jgi:CRISPR/Cas system-associated endonuclease Cas1
VLDEIFRNFVAEVAWKKLRSPKSQSAHFSNIKDSIFIYSKSSEVVLFNPQFVAKDEKLLDTHYRHVDQETGRRYNLDNLLKTDKAPNGILVEKFLNHHPENTGYGRKSELTRE